VVKAGWENEYAPLATFLKISEFPFPPKGGFPQIMMYKTTPRDQLSQEVPYAPSKTSGAM
jgi:hypothetical protein